MNAGSAGVPPAMSAKRESKVALLFEVEGSETSKRAGARYAGGTPALPAKTCLVSLLVESE